MSCGENINNLCPTYACTTTNTTVKHVLIGYTLHSPHIKFLLCTATPSDLGEPRELAVELCALQLALESAPDHVTVLRLLGGGVGLGLRLGAYGLGLRARARARVSARFRFACLFT